MFASLAPYCVLRFAPTRMNKQQLSTIHAADENLDIAAVAKAAAFYKYFVENYRGLNEKSPGS